MGDKLTTQTTTAASYIAGAKLTEELIFEVNSDAVITNKEEESTTEQ